MEKSKIDVHPYELPDLLADMRAGKLQVPRFQRDFVWPLAKTRALLDSIYKEFPIGSFFLWHAAADSPLLFRPLSELGIPHPRPGTEVTYILDGQQRLTSLFSAIYGLKLYGRDYGRICIDLEAATRYEENSGRDFDQEIFVYHRPDNERYIAVCDLVGDRHLDIYDQLPKRWKPVFNKTHRLLHRYPFSVVSIQEQTLSDAIEIFQRINQAGQRLSRFDLVCANIWREDFDFRKQVALLNKKFAQSGFGKLHETVYTQTFSLILKDECTTAAELSLGTDEVLEAWDRVIRSLELAVEFAINNLGVKRASYLPYRGLLVVLAYYFYHAPSSALSAREREVLWHWFWRVTLSERYSATSPSRMAEDALKLREAIEGKEITFDYSARVTPEAVAHTKMSSTNSALRNAYICMMALRRPKSLKDGSPINLTDSFFANLKRAERHHIFPVSYLKSQGWPAASVHLLPNFCFIPADLNKEIGNRAPADYLTHYRKENPQFTEAAESLLLPIDADAAVWRNDFAAFLQERAQRIAEELNRLADSGPGELEIAIVSETALSDVDLMEIRLRDFIDHRLTLTLGSHYWKKAMPGDVISHVKRLINEHLTRHPYEDRTEFASPRRRLDFCDVSHYEKIILKNWTLFEEFFGRKDEIQRHMNAYRTLRNCVQHNRPPSDIEQELGRAAMKWLGRILDHYDQETGAYAEMAEENGEALLDVATPVSHAYIGNGDAEKSHELSETTPPVFRVLGSRASKALHSIVARLRHDLPAEAAERFVRFLERLIEGGWDWRIEPQALGVAFRTRSLRVPKPGSNPKPMYTTVLFLRSDQGNPRFVFPVTGPWPNIVGFDLARHVDRLREIGCVFDPRHTDLNLYLRDYNSTEVFEQLYLVVQDIVTDMKHSLPL